MGVGPDLFASTHRTDPPRVKQAVGGPDQIPDFLPDRLQAAPQLCQLGLALGRKNHSPPPPEPGPLGEEQAPGK